jgi:OB-fold nucleic acid binding domain
MAEALFSAGQSDRQGESIMMTQTPIRIALTALAISLTVPALAEGMQNRATPSETMGQGQSGSGAAVPGGAASGSGSSTLMPSSQQQSAAPQPVQTIEALSGTKGSVQIQGRISDVDAANNQFTIADDTGDIDVNLQGGANLREGDRVQVTGTMTEETFGNSLQAERVELLDPRGGAAERTLYDRNKSTPQPGQKSQD